MSSTDPLTLNSVLRSISPASAAASRLLCDARYAAVITTRFGTQGLQISHKDDRQATLHDAVPARQPGRIVLGHLGGTVNVDFDLACYPALHFVAGSGSQPPQSPLRHALANALLAPVLAQCKAAGLGTWRVMSVSAYSAVDVLSGGADVLSGAPDALSCAADVARFHVMLRPAGVARHMSIEAGGAVLELLEEWLQATLPGEAGPLRSLSHNALTQLPIMGTIALGGRRLSVASLRRLQVGDVLLRAFNTQTARALANQTACTARAVWGAAKTSMPTSCQTRIHASVSIERHQLTILDHPIMSTASLQPDSPDTLPSEDHQMVEAQSNDGTASIETQHASQDHLSDEQSVLDIGQLDLPVQFEIDTISLPLAQIAALRQGYVIELPTPALDAPIRLVVHGQTIGYGELVSVGENLGLRITRMAYADPDQ